MALAKLSLNLNSVLTKTLVRSISSTSALNKNDPIQQLFVDKSREYYKKKSASKTGLVDSSPEAQKSLKDEMDKISKAFGSSATAEFPTLNFTEPKLDSINIEKQ